MNTEDDEFNRIEREASMRKAAVVVAIAKREWIGLTKEERKAAWDSCPMHTPTELALAIEAKLKELNS